ncbi:hypothetical protein [Actinomyces ruminis]|uniref:hypothetical protein n=1 Tax=Actinomyces ruminis TaxID=1937003 RepID=UPI00211EB615|nr:hypothetical protein [Actinomyces ruminis]
MEWKTAVLLRLGVAAVVALVMSAWETLAPASADLPAPEDFRCEAAPSPTPAPVD